VNVALGATDKLDSMEGTARRSAIRARLEDLDANHDGIVDKEDLVSISSIDSDAPLQHYRACTGSDRASACWLVARNVWRACILYPTTSVPAVVSIGVLHSLCRITRRAQVSFIDQTISTEQRLRTVTWVATAAVVALVVFAGATFGLTYAVVDMAKDAQPAVRNLLVSR